MKKLVALLFIAALVLVGFYYWGAEESPIPAFRTSKIDTGVVVATVSSTGVIDPITLVQVGSQISGTIKKINVDFNDRVKAGQIICLLDQTELRTRVSQDKANLAKARAQVERAEARLSVAGRNLKRARKLFSDSLISVSELDTEVANNEMLVAELSVAKANVKQVQSALAKSITNLGYATIRSPVDGVVISRNVDVGQTVAASLQAPVLFEIAKNLDKMHALASVSEADIGMIKDGQNVSFTVDAHQESFFTGTVLQIRLSPTVEQNVVTYTVVVSADNPDGLLLPGMTANINFEVGRTGEDAMRVKNSALRFEPDGEWLVESVRIERRKRSYSNGQLWVLENNQLKSITVELGLTDGTYTQIRGGEVRIGQDMIVGVKEVEINEFRNPFQRRWGLAGKKKKKR